jgi:hypothetical protein
MTHRHRTETDKENRKGTRSIHVVICMIMPYIFGEGKVERLSLSTPSTSLSGCRRTREVDDKSVLSDPEEGPEQSQWLG